MQQLELAVEAVAVHGVLAWGVQSAAHQVVSHPVEHDPATGRERQADDATVERDLGGGGGVGELEAWGPGGGVLNLDWRLADVGAGGPGGVEIRPVGRASGGPVVAPGRQGPGR